jgi:hypothetical protein
MSLLVLSALNWSQTYFQDLDPFFGTVAWAAAGSAARVACVVSLRRRRCRTRNELMPDKNSATPQAGPAGVQLELTGGHGGLNFQVESRPGGGLGRSAGPGAGRGCHRPGPRIQSRAQASVLLSGAGPRHRDRDTPASHGAVALGRRSGWAHCRRAHPV